MKSLFRDSGQPVFAPVQKIFYLSILLYLERLHQTFFESSTPIEKRSRTRRRDKLNQTMTELTGNKTKNRFLEVLWLIKLSVLLARIQTNDKPQ